SIPPGIDKTDCHPENEIRLSQRLLYDNSYPHPSEEFNSENSNAEIESFSPSPIPNEDSDSFMEEINLFLTPDDPMPPRIEDDEDSEGDILFERLLHDDPIPLSDTLDFSYEVIIFLPFFTYPERSDSLDDNIISGLPPFSAITPNEPVLSTEEPDNSLSMGDEHLDTIPATESVELIKSSVEDLIPIPSESEGIPDHMCDVPFHDNSPPLDVSKDQSKDFFESNDEFSSTDDDSSSFDKIDYVEASPPDCQLRGDEDCYPGKVDAFLAVEDEPTSSQFPKSYLDPKGDFLLLEAFLYDDHSSDFKTKSSSTSLNSLLEETNNFDNSLPDDDQSCSDEDVLEKIVSKPLFEEEIIPMKMDQHPDNAESALMESLRTHDSSLPVPSKIDFLLDEFVGELTLLKSISPGIDETDCDFEEDIRLIEKLLYNNSSSHPPKEFVSANSDAEIESFSPSPILVKDSDSLMKEIDLTYTPDYPMLSGIEDKDYDSERDILIHKDLASNNTLLFAEKESFHFDIPPFSHLPAKPPDGDTGIFNIKMMGDISDQKDFMHKLMITLASHQEKSPDLLSHRALKAFQSFAKCLMMIHGQNNHILDVLLFQFIPLDQP
nr:hypothetical protein [Tanacetum cinerariifolium]